MSAPVSIPPQSQPFALKIELVSRTLRMHWFSEKEIEDIRTLGITAAIYLAFLCLAIGLAASFWIVLSYEPQGLPASTHAVYVGILSASIFGSLLTGILFAVSLAVSAQDIVRRDHAADGRTSL